jgi:pimeloyl-ACP methyl ester carboxylesterase
LTERMIEANGVELCTEAFGDPADAPILLIMGIEASMLWWEEDFCWMLAGAGRFVIRYDHRDTGRSVTYEPGWPGGGIAQEVAPTPGSGRFVATVELDRSTPESIIEYPVDYSRILAGGERAFDETRARELVRRDIERARDFAAVQNHNLMSHGEGSPGPLSSITSPTLVIHGTADPMFPSGHGDALAEEIPGARLLRVEGAGHWVDSVDWDVVVDAILEHT